jgi:IS30 family transposase
MSVEEIVSEILEVKNEVLTAIEKQDRLLKALISAKERDWDLVSVCKASEKSGLSVTTIYRLINSGKLRCFHKGALKYVSSTELEKLDCR